MRYRIELIELPSDQAKSISSTYAYWHNPLFMQAVAEMHKIRALQLQVFKGDELLAILPLYERKKMGIKALVAPSGTYYQGICFAFSPQSHPSRNLIETVSIIEEIADFLASRYIKLTMRLSPENYDVRGFTWKGYKAQVLYTSRWFLDTELKILPDERKKLRQAETEGMELREGFDMEVFLRLQRDLELRKNHSLGISHQRIADFFTKLHELGLLQQFNLHQKAQIVSSNILLTDHQEVAYTINLATAPEAMKRGAATYHSVALAKMLPPHTRILDYCGANVKEVSRFKSALGLELQSFYQIKR
jgi:hypothetical protein